MERLGDHDGIGAGVAERHRLGGPVDHLDAGCLGLQGLAHVRDGLHRDRRHSRGYEHASELAGAGGQVHHFFVAAPRRRVVVGDTRPRRAGTPGGLARRASRRWRNPHGHSHGRARPICCRTCRPSPPTDLDFAYLEAGPSDGPLALCLHGFPDAAPTWNALLGDLGDAGFHAVAPWLRGYAPTSIPADGSYGVGALEADANALHEALGGGPDAVIIGHDWGAIATYGIAVAAPDRWRRVVTMAVPPAPALGAGFLSYDQLQRSWYMFFFQSPMAEMAVGHERPRVHRPAVGRTGHPATTAPHTSPRSRTHCATRRTSPPRSATTAPCSAATDPSHPATAGTPTQPVLYLHGRNDGCLGVDLTTSAAMFLSPESRVEVLDDCGHFLQVEKPAEVNKLVLDWVS